MPYANFYKDKEENFDSGTHANAVYQCEDTGNFYLFGKFYNDSESIYNDLYGGNLDVTPPTITGTWTFFDNTSVQVSASDIVNNPTTTGNPILEYGYGARFIGSYSWTSQDGYKDPESITSDSNWSTLTTSGEASDNYSTGIVFSATTVKVTLEAAKTGFMVDGTTVVPASGNDSATDTKSVSFQYRCYYGAMSSNSVTESNIKALTNTLTSTRSRTVSSVTTSTSQYYVYAYPQSLGALTTIIQDGAEPILGAFTRSSLTITNDAGLSVALYVYVSNNPGAFTSASIAFS